MTAGGRRKHLIGMSKVTSSMSCWKSFSGGQCEVLVLQGHSTGWSTQEMQEVLCTQQAGAAGHQEIVGRGKGSEVLVPAAFTGIYRCLHIVISPISVLLPNLLLEHKPNR